MADVGIMLGEANAIMAGVTIRLRRCGEVQPADATDHLCRLDECRSGCHIVTDSWQVAQERPMPRAKGNTTLTGVSESPSPAYAAAPPVYASLDDLARAAEVTAPIARATPGALAGLSRRGYSEEEIWRLVVPKRTLARRHAANEPLTIEETDKALRLERVASLAERVFGEPDKAHRWMRKPKRGLNGATPVDFLASEAGARKIEAWLHRIDHGMAA